MLKWDSSYSVKVKQIDDQHRQMIDYINQVELAPYGEDNRITIVNVLNGLVAYTRDHFATEETYFKRFDYEKADAHITEHLKLMNDVEQLVYRFEIGDKLDLKDVSLFLEHWLLDHILGEDKEYMSCFSNNGLT